MEGETFAQRAAGKKRGGVEDKGTEKGRKRRRGVRPLLNITGRLSTKGFISRDRTGDSGHINHPCQATSVSE